MDSPRVFLSFIGLGPHNRIDGSYNYTEVEYIYKDRIYRSRYIQSTIIGLERQAGIEFDHFLFAMTPKSQEWHWDKPGRLRDEMDEATLKRVQTLLIDENMSVEAQWANFGKLLEAVPSGARLHVDMTHGFRIIPILLSVAAELLVQVKGVKLEAVYYGAFEHSKLGPFPIAEFSGFFSVTRWTEAVRAVTEDANPHKLVEMAKPGAGLEMPGLNNPELVEALTRVSAVIKNADTVSAAETFTDAIRVIQKARQEAAGLPMALLKLLEDKFSDLSRAGADARLSRPWYETQLILAEVMIRHDLLMQGLTVLSELFCSCCEELCGQAAADPQNPHRISYIQKKGVSKFRKKMTDTDYRRNMGEALYILIGLKDRKSYDPKFGWDKDGLLVKPLTEAVFEERLRAEDAREDLVFLNSLKTLRNSFNHGWIGKVAVDSKVVKSEANAHLEQMSRLVTRMLDDGRIGRGEPKFT